MRAPVPIKLPELKTEMFATGRTLPAAEPKCIEHKSAAEPPRRMQVDERRLIAMKLEEVYLNKREGYAVGWSDKRVALDMGIAPAWVAEVRDFMFGPDVSRNEAQAILTSARELLEETQAHLLICKEESDRLTKKATLLSEGCVRLEKVLKG